MPTPQDLRTSAPLTGFSIRYSNSEYIADLAFPARTDITKDEGTIRTYGKDNLRTNDAAGPLAAETPAPRVTWNPGSDVAYKLGRYGLTDMVPQQLVDNADEVFDPKMDAVENLTDRLLVLREKSAADVAFTAGNWASTVTLTGTDQWSDDTSGPIDHIETALDAIVGDATHIILGQEVWSEVRHHPDVLERYQYTTGGGVNKAQFAAIFDLPADAILIGKARHVSSEDPTETVARLWGKHVLVARILPAPGKRTMTAMATLQRRLPREVSEWPNHNPKGVNVLVEDYFQHKVVASDLGYLIVDAVA